MSPRHICHVLALCTLVAAAAATAAEPQFDPGKGLFPGDDPVDPTAASPPWADFHLGAFEGHSLATLSNWPAAEAQPPIDMLHYNIDVAFSLFPAYISGTVTTTLRWQYAPGNTFRLDLKGLTASAVLDCDGNPIPFTQDADGLEITINPTPVFGQIIRLDVVYGGTPTAAYVTGNTTTYTFAEPNGARHWFPCRDVPWDKASFRLQGWVQTGQKLVSNGVLDSVVVDTAGATYHWREDHQIATYLISVAMANFTTVSATSSVVPMTWHVWPWDKFKATNAFVNVPAMMDFFHNNLHPYGFDKYDQVESTFSGAMEHQSCTLFGSHLIQSGLAFEWVHTHELAHHWFGDLVTLADWRNIWLNEGFATFYDAVWHEEFYGAAKFDQRMQIFEDSVFGMENADPPNLHTIYDPPPGQLFSAIIYRKGAWVLRMLRDLIGKQTYDDAIRDYLLAHAYGNATTADLQGAMEARYGQPLQWFFDQWVYNGLGHPDLRYVAKYTQFGDEWLVQLDLKQVQSPPATLYAFPLEVRATTTGGDVLGTVWVEAVPHQVVSFSVPDRPTAVAFDPANKILEEHFQGSPTAVGDDLPTITTLAAWPNPFSRQLNLALAESEDPSAEVTIFDIRGRRVRALQATSGRAAWDGQDGTGRRAAPGTYFVRVGERGDARRVVLLPQ